MRSFLALVPLAVIAVAAGCSSSPSPGAANGAGDDAGAAEGGAGGDAATNPNLTSVTFQMEETVPGGGEEFKCKYVQLPSVPAWMVQSEHNYTPGSHHMLLYTTSLTAIPAGGDQLTDCYEGTGNNIMANATGILYGGQTPTGKEQLPPGIGLPTKANEVLIFQTHYLNASAGPLDATVNVTLTLDTNADDIQTQAGIIFFYDPFIDVPPGATSKASMRCQIPGDITLLYGSSHYHSRGVGYGAYIDPAVDQLASTPFYTSSSWSSPDNAQLNLPVKAGSRIRFECDYDNSAGTSEYFSGQSAQTNEMCMFIGLYYPEMGQLADFCYSGADMLGTGSATCSTTLSCYEACPSSGSGGGGGPLGIDVSDCEQKCMVASCPTAAAPLVAFSDCVSKSCSSQCSNASSSACTSCVTQSCGSQYLACSNHTCP
ncbi:MAG: hypothetical protein ACRELB_07060 [Polyangiaceae bacterium]